MKVSVILLINMPPCANSVLKVMITHALQLNQHKFCKNEIQHGLEYANRVQKLTGFTLDN